MGQKVNPNGVRVGVIQGWTANWYADKKDFAKNLKQDYDIRTFIKKKYYADSISKVVIERSQNKVTVNIYTGKTGVLIGVKGAGVEQIRKELKKLTGLPDVKINIREVKKVDLDATLVAENIAFHLEKRESFRRTMKKAMSNVMRSGAKGVKTMVSGRLDGAEIARSEHYHEGSIPLQTLRADIDYGFAIANTTFGVLGVKVWIYKGEVLSKSREKEGGNDNVNA
ncbi:MAG: 30S ribosomal protein S3 [Clostridia bacterium]|nr:30S ribosomal protein S3 [Clostridia bacterium]MBP5592995.1 30S ribosomal protein S3 [Clostridia bacterium]MBP5649116.1 30S ribosomal protein S3 [Clostridia bacterium]